MKMKYNITREKFNLLAILFCLAGDIQFIRYLYYRFTDFDKGWEFIRQLQKTGDIPSDIPDAYFTDLFELTANLVSWSLAAALLFHGILYFFFHKEKPFPRKYMTLLAWSGVVGSLSMIIATLDLSSLLWLIQTGLYLYVALGLKWFAKHS